MECGKWGSLEEQIAQKTNKQGKADLHAYPGAKTTALGTAAGKPLLRAETGIHELDRVFGGGIVPGSLTLLGGDPGVGKSTLALQLAAAVPNTLYISGEESVEQIQLRAARLGLGNAAVRLANETRVQTIAATIVKEKPPLAIVDSIQTIASDEAPGESGNVTQVRACTALLLQAAKENNISIVLIGHVTKDGALAGPKTLEHLVDTVLYLEGDRHHGLRILRSTKNRFGSTDEIGVFDMTEQGFIEVKNPSEALLSERGQSASGSVLTCLLEGTRPMLVEVQALVSKTSFGYPVRKASGFDLNRLHVLIAVLERRAGIDLSKYDVHVNVVGGLKANEPAADLAVCLSVASAYKDKVLGNDLVCFGEVGLGGEIRSVRQTEKRLKECAHVGGKRVIMPKMKKAATGQKGDGKGVAIKKMEVENIQELVRHA